MPIIGYLGPGGPEGGADIVAAIRRGLGEVGLVDREADKYHANCAPQSRLYWRTRNFQS